MSSPVLPYLFNLSPGQKVVSRYIEGDSGFRRKMTRELFIHPGSIREKFIIEKMTSHFTMEKI